MRVNWRLIQNRQSKNIEDRLHCMGVALHGSMMKEKEAVEEWKGT